VANGRTRLAEGEGESLDARVERDFERPIEDRLRLADQLIQPLLDDRAVAVFVDVQAAGRSRWPSVY
jgi:hypothetical protein